MTAAHDIRQLASRLAGRVNVGVRLSPQSTQLTVIALRVYADLLDQPTIEQTLPFKVEGLDAAGRPFEVLAIVTNAIIARAAFDQAVIQRPGRALQLRQGARVLAEKLPDGNGTG